MTPEETVNQFMAAVQRRDLDAAMALVTDDVEYDNVPMPKAHGPAEVRAFLEPFLGGAEEIDWVVHRQVADGDVVMNERTDRFKINGKWIDIPVAGIWELRDGKIALWRDYFDLAGFTNQMSG